MVFGSVSLLGAAKLRLCTVCVCRVLILKAPGSSPLRGQPACHYGAPEGRPTRTTPPVIPLPESLAAQGPYVRLPCPGLARARNVSRHWGPPRACYRVPCCETLKRETPAAPRRVQGGLSGSPRVRWNKQNTEIPRPSSPAGTAAAECP